MTKKSMNKNLAKSLSIAKSEKDVENAYRQAFSHYFPSTISSPNKVDGLLESEPYVFLMEFKHKFNLKEKINQAEILVQLLFYLKKLEEKGTGFPSSVFAGDMFGCFCNSVKSIFKYLSRNLDWNIAPSKAPGKYPDLVKELSTDIEIQPFIYDIDKNFDFSQVVEKMKAIYSGETFSISISPTNIVPIFTYFKDNVITERKAPTEIKENKRISRLVDIFFSCLTDKDNVFLHPKKANTLICRGDSFKVNANLFVSFFSQFKQDYTSEELRILTSCKDRVLEELYRRRTGAFFTPKIWADEIHKMISKIFGSTCYTDLTWFYPGCGTANLSKDYPIENLFLCTLEHGDVDTINDMGYYKKTPAFQYDFLNDDVWDQGRPTFEEEKLRKFAGSLVKNLEDNKSVIVIMNPPYGTAGELKSKNISKKSRSGISRNKINECMLREKLGLPSSQLYAQFLYRILQLPEQYKNENIKIAFFSPTSFLTTRSFKDFRSKFLSKFKFLGGMVFNASHFADVSGNWGLMFSVWESGNSEEKNVFEVELKDVSKFGEIETVGKKILYNVDALENCADWVREEIKGLKFSDGLRLKSALVISDDGRKGKSLPNQLGFLYYSGNVMYESILRVSMLTATGSVEYNGFPITEENFLKTVAAFSARKLSTFYYNWSNSNDEYLKPNVNHKDYQQWNLDCIIYSLFESASQQSSLRNISYRNNLWKVFNQFFFMSNKEMSELANKCGFNEMYQDSKQFPEDRYVYKLLETVHISDDAKRILEYAKELIRKSMSVRQTFHEEYKECHLNAWDSGWAQLKPMLKKIYPEELKTFNELYKKFSERLREGVYKFGFLK